MNEQLQKLIEQYEYDFYHSFDENDFYAKSKSIFSHAMITAITSPDILKAAGLVKEEWVSVEDRLPDEFNEFGQTKHYLVYIDNPFFKDGNYHVAYFEKSGWGTCHWRGIEPNVSHGIDQPNVTHWMELPLLPKTTN